MILLVMMALMPMLHQAILSSEDPRELWPVILSKALYKLHRLVGAKALNPDLREGAGKAVGRAGAITEPKHCG
jgi:hypothetical protein